MKAARAIFQTLRGRETTTSTTRPMPSRVMVEAERASSRAAGSPPSRAYRNTSQVATAARVPAGSEKRRTRSRNPRWTRFVLGASARTIPGRPMLKVPMSVRWRGRNGNSMRCRPMMAVSSRA